MTHDCNQNIESNMTPAHCSVCGKDVTNTDERVEEIVGEICDLTGYGQALHPNDIKHYFITYGAEMKAKGREEGVKAEREACAVSVWNYLSTFPDCLESNGRVNALNRAIALIRERGNK